MTTAVIAMSDWHIGRENMPTHNRACSIAKKVLKHPMLPKKVDAFALVLLGDLMDGARKFRSHQSINHTTVSEQKRLTKHAVKKNVNEFAKTGKELYVFFEPGNHGVLSSELHPDDNIEAMMMHDLADELADVATCTPPSGDDTSVIGIEETTGVIIHKGPAHIDTKARRCDALSEIYEHGADWILCAHLHHVGITSQGFWYFRNGSLMDRGERYAKGLHLYDSPRQIVLLIDDNRVIGSFWVEFD